MKIRELPAEWKQGADDFRARGDKASAFLMGIQIDGLTEALAELDAKLGDFIEYWRAAIIARNMVSNGLNAVVSVNEVLDALQVAFEVPTRQEEKIV